MFWIFVLVGALFLLVGSAIVVEKNAREEGRMLAERTSIDNPDYQGSGMGLVFLGFIVGLLIVVALISSGEVRISLFVLGIPIILTGLAIGYVNGKADGFNETMREKIKDHKALIKADKKRMRKAKIRKVLRFWE